MGLLGLIMLRGVLGFYDGVALAGLPKWEEWLAAEHVLAMTATFVWIESRLLS